MKRDLGTNIKIANDNGLRSGRRTGTQAVERALALLLQIASDDGAGQRLTDLSARTNLDASTVRRLLSSMARHGFIEQDARNRRYFLGLEFFTIAAAASNRLDLASTTHQTLWQLAAETGATAAFCLRSEADLVCVDVARAPHQLGGPMLDMGSRRPIGSGAFGIAVLAAMPDQEGEDLVLRNIRRMSRTSEDIARNIYDQRQHARRHGYACEHDPETGFSTFAVAIINRDGRPEGALGLTLLTAANDNAHVACHVRALARQARAMEETVWRLPPAHRRWNIQPA